MAKIEAGIISDIFKKLTGVSDSLSGWIQRGVDWLIKNGVEIDNEDIKVSEDGGIICKAKLGDGQYLKFKALPVNGKKDLFDLYIKSDNGKRKDYPHVTKDQFTEKLTEYADEFMGVSLEDTFEDLEKNGNLHDEDADFDINESKHLKLTLQKISSSDDISIQLTAVNANYNPSQALVDIQEIVDSDDVIDMLTDEPTSFDILVSDDGYDLNTTECVDCNAGLVELIKCSYQVYLNLQCLHWNSIGKKFMRIHTMLDEYLDYIRTMIDRLAEIYLQTNPNIMNPIYLVNGLSTSLPDGNIEGDVAAHDASDIIMGLVDAINLYYPNVDHDIQSEFDEWIGYLKSEALYKLARM